MLSSFGLIKYFHNKIGNFFLIILLEVKKILALTSNLAEDSISIVDCDNNYKVDKLTFRKLQTNNISSKYDYPIGPFKLLLHPISNLIYSVNCYNNTIYLIDYKNKTLLNKFCVGSFPNGMVVDWMKNLAYITNCDSNNISIIDINTGELLLQLYSGLMPVGIKFKENCEELYIANMQEKKVSIINCKKTIIIHWIKVECSPLDILLSKDEKYLFISSACMGINRNGYISKIDIESNKVVKKIEVGIIPHKMLLSEDGNTLYATNFGSDDVSIINVDNLIGYETIKCSRMPKGIVIDKEKKYLYVTSLRDNVVDIININERRIEHKISVGKEPSDIILINK